MKNSIVLLMALVFGITVCVAQKKTNGPYEFRGDVNLVKRVNTAYLVYIDTSGKIIKDSVAINNGNFVFKGVLAQPLLAYLYLTRPSAKRKKPEPVGDVQVFLEPGIINIKATDTLFKNPQITGSLLTGPYRQLGEQKRVYFERMSKIEARLSKTDKSDTVTIHKLQVMYDTMRHQIPDSLYKPFFLTNLDNYFSVYILYLYVGNDMDAVKVEPLYNQINTRYLNTPLALEIKQRIVGTKQNQIGQLAADFTLPDTLGKSVSLSSFRGKYLLLDFWASWCGPCRHENPVVLAAFNKFKNKDFTILSVSIDAAKANWLKAVKDDKLPWTHAIDYNGKKVAINGYNIGTIPQNLLIDPTGKIIAKNLRGDDLEKKLAEFLGQ